MTVRKAFLIGKVLDREAYARAPKEGLPVVEGAEAVRPYGLLEVLKGAYGLTDAPRLWYLRARELLPNIGFIELKCCRAVFILWESEKLIAVLTLRVEDGLLWGDTKSMSYQKATLRINQTFNIKK